MILKITRVDTDNTPVVEVWDKVSHLRWEQAPKRRADFHQEPFDGPKKIGIQFILGNEPPPVDEGLFYEVAFESWGIGHVLAVHEGVMYLCNDEGETVDKSVFKRCELKTP